MWFGKNKRVYADAAAATPLGPRAKAEMLRLIDVYGNAGGLHKEAVAAKAELEKARKMIADSIGAHSDEIIFTGSGTEGNNLAIAGVLRPLLRSYFAKASKDGTHKNLHAITCAIEHQSVLEPLRALQKEGLDVTELGVDREGLLQPKAIAEAARENTALVSIQLINSEVGSVLPVREIAKEIRRARQSRGAALPLYFHTDASQAPLWTDIKVERLGVDLMTLDAQKVLGPKGVGVLYVKRGTKIEPILYGGVQENNLRAGTPNPPLAGAFAVALEDAQKDAGARVARVAEVRDYCFEEIKKLLPDAVLNGATFEKRAANNLNISIPGLEAQMAVIALDAEGVAAATRSACNAGDEEPSHVMQALLTNEPDKAATKKMAGTAIRITFLPDVTTQEAKKVAEALYVVAKRYGQKSK